ncbi:hypothetical protein GLOIN_2v1564001 [Rhizophagus irregularis DAOM 181602=DAOM 197198]|uniref:Uncharacterized protein n=1 Tax=Rhizophagus irregularis (strain DAOM 181602 / DAOM 197198 / MUCL 43194) TaxID=747089 RepID=A0A2P4QD87_RHIID|nr:hypothetical protein GLOIN_2v1564001 [Rhizophagus irregularis DAOM 181602=DAOM 197198]POG75595.1 hypothetical protein GLOIN_2v1564001 [Rhizophagus irregularis DAOM 181602=DAOM 197198]|eukprot:XP_025182461.1 hypothetical protein GLOIN_2v1564001 [Rhizophagus irregularis DAOM 181602=DAOM 197198]
MIAPLLSFCGCLSVTPCSNIASLTSSSPTLDLSSAFLASISAFSVSSLAFLVSSSLMRCLNNSTYNYTLHISIQNKIS